MRALLLSRQAVGVAGIALALVGIRFDTPWIIWVAIALLAASVLHRLVGVIQGRRRR